MTQLTRSDHTIADQFKWKTAHHHGGELLSPHQMTTKHLFYTWLMIWNHAAPEPLRIWNNHRYVFGDFYTPEYMLTAFREMYRELQTRHDLGPQMQGVMTRIETLYTQTVYRQAELTQ